MCSPFLNSVQGGDRHSRGTQRDADLYVCRLGYWWTRQLNGHLPGRNA